MNEARIEVFTPPKTEPGRVYPMSMAPRDRSILLLMKWRLGPPEWHVGNWESGGYWWLSTMQTGGEATDADAPLAWAELPKIPRDYAWAK